MQIIRRLLLGSIIGLVSAILIVVVVNQTRAISGRGVTVAELGGAVELLVVGVLMGSSLAWLFRPQHGESAANLLHGLIVGLAAWVILAMNVIPGLMGQAPMWAITDAARVFPMLMVYLWQGALLGLVYGFIYQGFGETLRLDESGPPAKVPEITTGVVILGGGYAGVNAAQAIERELGDDPSVGIWLVSGTNYLLHTPMLSEVSASALDPQHISPVLRRFFRRVQVVQGNVERVDLARKIVHLEPDAPSPHRKLEFDHLILTVGGVPNFFGNDSVEAEAFTFKSLEDAVILRNQMIGMFERADLEPDIDRRRRMLTFVVAGGGFAGVELIGSLNDFARGILPFYPNILAEELRLVLIHSRDTILPELSKSLGKYAQEKLEERGIEFKLETRVTGAERSRVILDDEVLHTETFVWTAGNRSSPILETLGQPLTRRGQISVNTELAVSGVPGLWAAGDCAQIPDSSTGKFCPPTAQHALRQGKVVGYNVAASIKGRPLKTFHFKTLGSLAVLGHQLAVAEIMGYRFSGFLAWLVWRGIYLSKLPTLEKRVRVGLDWLLDIFFPPDVVQTIDFSRSSALDPPQRRPSMTTGASPMPPGKQATLR